MGTADDQAIRLLLQVTDSGSIEEAVGKFLRLKGVVKETADTYAIADQKGDQFAIGTKELTHAIDKEVQAAVDATTAHKAMAEILREQTEESLRTATAAAEEAASALGTGGRGGKAGFGRAALQAQYAMDDFVAVYKDGGFARALSSMQNNIPQIALALGATGGLTAGIGAVAIGIGLATPIVKKFWDEWNGHPENEVKKLEELEKKLEEFRKRAGLPTAAEGAAAKQLQGAFTEGGYDTIAKGLAETLAVSGRPDRAQMTAEERIEFESAERLSHPLLGVASAAQLKRSAETKKRITDAVTARNLARAQQLMVDAGAKNPVGAGARDTLKALINANPGAFPAGLLGDIENADPANIKQQAEFEAEGKRNIEAMARADKAKKDKEDADRKAAQARIKARQERIKQEAEFFDQKEREDAEKARAAEHADAEGQRENDRIFRDIEANKRHWDAVDKREANQAARQQKATALQGLRRVDIANKRADEDQAYWAKFNNGMITAADQIERRSALLRRQTEDMRMRVQQSMMQNNDG